METCSECKIEYPDGYCDFVSTSDGNTGLLCGICVLIFMNKYMGAKREKFDGDVAEGRRLKAIAYREENNIKPL